MSTESKECFRCKVSLPLSQFYKHKIMRDGHLNKCIQCTKLDVSRHRAENIDSVRDYDKRRANLPDRRKKALELCQKLKGRTWAIQRLRRARKAGQVPMLPTDCSVCSSSNPAGGIVSHHDDYSKPLDVRFLCRTCHRNWHVENGPGKFREGVPGVHF